MRVRLQWVPSIIAALVAGFIVSGCGDNGAMVAVSTSAATPTATPTVVPLTSAQVLQPGPYDVGVTTMTFIDTSRPTMPNGTFSGAPGRTLVTEIWYPTDSQPIKTPTRNAPLTHFGAPFPLVIYSHALMSNRAGGSYLTRHLASYGYVVAAPDFPLSNNGAPGGPTFVDLANQPGDVHFVIDQLLALGDDTQSALAGSIDRARIGLTGFSMGGSTTFLAALHPTLRDPRVRAAAAMAGVTCFLGPDFYGHTSVPLLIVHGDIDAFAPYQANALPAFGEANPPKYLVTIAGGSHIAFTDGIDVIFQNVNNPDDIGCRSLGDATLDVDSPAVVDSLGGAAAGIVAGFCPASCTNQSLPRSIRPTRQLQLTILSIFPFFEAYLRGDARARLFLDETLAAENPDVTTQLQVAGN
jgi:predicted dienelactone hydrolase